MKLAQNTEGFSGADITEICQRAAKNAIRQDIAVDIDNARNELAGSKTMPLESVQCISKQHFEEAMSRARRSVSEAQIEQYKQFIQKQKADASQAVGFKFGEKQGQGDGSVDGEENGEGSEAEIANGKEKDESLYG
jgi:transitional endoplasmic reticulum ATPase